MGCCFSTPNTKQPQKDQNVDPKHQQQHQQPHLGCHEQNVSRISQPVEEETVKEVLSETPVSKPQQVPILTPQTKTQSPVLQNPKVPIRKALESEEMSLASETCSNGESLSTTTTATVTENREDEATSKRNRNRRRYCAVDGRERRTQSPARKPETPARPRPIRRKELDQPRRHSGERVVRRSRPPSCADGSQVRASVRRVPARKGVVEENDGVSVQESLENPHVSLECFIFL
ncbi:hypothetical protein Fmac_019312 [Flemingia macrophylla]|uniref:Uncharacterized protein n=1 Tax=Flemingia macrophylla TaxID=520843 RepID=A0ABD1M7H0_9FABA